MRGQEYRGTVAGLFTEASGAALPGVEVALTNLLTNVTLQTRTTEAGVYTFRLVQPRRYRINVRKSGLREASVPEAAVQTGVAVTADVRLEGSDIVQSVESRAEAPPRNTANADCGQVIQLEQH